jgi:quercetin dioxygenase-like cupin family protein
VKKHIGSFVSSAALLWSLSSIASAADPVTVKSEVLLSASNSWDGTAYSQYPQGVPQITVLRLSLAPNTTLPWHTHPMVNVAYIVSGELLLERQDGAAKRRLVAGDVVPEMVGAIHRGVTGDVGVTLIVFYAGVKGMPLTE